MYGRIGQKGHKRGREVKRKDLFKNETIISDSPAAFVVRKRAVLELTGVPKVICGGQSKRIMSRVFGVGRDKSNALIMADAKVSKFHALFSIEKGTLFIKDTGSTNGTYVNDKPLPKNRKIRLNPGDVMRFGDTILEYRN